MKKFILLSLSLSLVLCCLDSARAVDLYEMRYKCLDLKGNERWRATTEIVLMLDEISFDIFELIEKGEGFYSGFSGKVSWETRLEFREGKNNVRPLNMQKHIFDANGKLLAAEFEEFHFSEDNNNTVTVRREDLITGQKKEKVFAFEGDIVNRPLLAMYIQKFLTNGENERLTYMINGEPRLYRLRIKIAGKERIEIDGKKTMSYKVHMDPELGFLNVFKILLPKLYMWHLAKPRFDWLKYTGPESTIRSPEVIMLRGK